MPATWTLTSHSGQKWSSSVAEDQPINNPADDGTNGGGGDQSGEVCIPEDLLCFHTSTVKLFGSNRV